MPRPTQPDAVGRRELLVGASTRHGPSDAPGVVGIDDGFLVVFDGSGHLSMILM